MAELTNHDLHFVVTRIPRDVREMLKTRRPLFLAGGFIRATIAGERINDIDLFGDTKPALENAAAGLALSRTGGKMHATDNAFTVLTPPRKPVQFIHRWLFTDAAELSKSFDFTIAQAVIWWDGAAWQSVIGDGFYPDLAARRLVYTAPQRNEDAGGSLMRARKFLMRGYNIQAPSLAAVVARLIGGVKDQTILWQSGEDGRTRILTGLLREVDPLIAIDGIDLVSEHEGEEV